MPNESKPVSGEGTAVSGSEVARLTEHLFREQAGKLVSVLTGIFGIERLQLAEDVVQEAMMRALRTWPYRGIPENPAGWLTQTAKNLALDLIRREKTFESKQPQIVAWLEQWPNESAMGESPRFEDELRDGRLRLMFACCHPLLPQEAQSALALKTLCGFGTEEIANAFLTSEAAVAKRLTRARQRIRELAIPFAIPEGEELRRRLESVLQVLYLLFNEGYKASTGDHLIREDLCREAIRLGTLLAEHPAGNQPQTHAFVALMLFNAARLPARIDAEGNILRLEEQNRTKWNRELIDRGMFHLHKSASGNGLSAYHLQAAIAACHCAAPDYNATDWPRILSLYDRLLEIDPSPVVALNRAVAIAKVHGPKAGIDAVDRIRGLDQLQSYHLLHAVLGELETELGHFEAAAIHFKKALKLTGLTSEQNFLLTRMRDCEEMSLKNFSPARQMMAR
jgi:RNA polymerase sigma factor (sigma-70 family)